MSTDAARLVRCPACRNVLEIPTGYHGTRVMCSGCDTKFLIPPGDLTEAEIADWLGEPDKDETHANEVAVDVPAELLGENEMAPEITQQDLTIDATGFRLVRLSSRGAIFEFPASKLYDKAFRGAMPRCCMRCGTKTHIQPHLIVFSHEMRDTCQLEIDFVSDRVEISEHDIRDMPMDNILERLPKIQRIDPPGDLPMPYWMCDMCSPSNMVFARGDFTHEEDGGTCRLQVRRLWRAEEFLVNAGGKESGAHAYLIDELEKNPEKPWDTLAGVVQQRLQQWYRPHRGEMFRTYVPDATRTRTENGMSGILISNRRLIYHTSMRHREATKGEPLELDFALRGQDGTVHIKHPKWEVKKAPVTKLGLQRLRRGLSDEGFDVIWR